MTDLINQLRVYCSTLPAEQAHGLIDQTRILVKNMDDDLRARFTYRFTLVQLYPFNNFAPARLVGPGITLVLNGIDDQQQAPHPSFGAKYMFATLTYIGERQCDPTKLRAWHIDKYYELPWGWLDKLEIFNANKERVYAPASGLGDEGSKGDV